MMRADYQTLLEERDPAPLFDRWRGGKAAIWGYTISHRILEIRVFKENVRLCLCLYLGDVQRLCGPTKWESSDFELETVSREAVILRDRQAGFEVHAGLLGVKEIVPD